jgi:two-component sensor histidine kinase
VARRRLLGDLAAAGVLEAAACDASLILSELISNALRHASPLPGGMVKVSWRLSGDCVEIAVGDGGGPTAPVVNRPAAGSLGGRGLGIVDRLSLRWGVYSRPDGGETTVWAELALSSEDVRHRDGMAENGPDGRHGTAPGLVIASSRDA